MFKSLVVAAVILVGAGIAAVTSVANAADLPRCDKVSNDVTAIVGTAPVVVPVYSCRVEING